MRNKKEESLQGRNNQRLETTKATNCECTAAWQNKDKEYNVDEVNKPSLDNVVEAKDWVDNGSKL
jgi:hypothetical protein